MLKQNQKAWIESKQLQGILIKGSDYIDTIKDIKEIVFDKTGTLTKGEFEVKQIESFVDYTEKEILK